MKFARRYVEKPWGRTELPPIFDAPRDQRIGEVWFTGGDDLPLLAKYIFTSERLSIQVHPNEEQAHTRGLAHGKNECWYILEAEPDSTIGLGLTRDVTAGELRASALDGSIEGLIDWKPVARGDFLYVPAGTVHAIGAGISLLEFQQNVDVTYRLYDYGRPRELHLDDAVSVSRRGAYPENLRQHVTTDAERVLLEGPPFSLVLCREDTLTDRRRWVLPLEGTISSNGDVATAGECLLVEAGETVSSHEARMLIGATA